MLGAFRIIPGELQESGEKSVRLVVEEASPERAVAALRFLADKASRWETTNAGMYIAVLSEPAILLGRFQKPSLALSEVAFESVGVVRRNTGGRAMLLPKGSIYFGLVIPRYMEALPKPITPRRAYKVLMSYFLEPLSEFLASHREEIGVGDELTRQEDHILWRGSPVGGISFDFTEDQTAVLEGWLLAGTDPCLPEEYNNYPRPSIVDFFPYEARSTFSAAVMFLRDNLDEFSKDVLSRLDFATTMQNMEWNTLESAVIGRYEQGVVVSASEEDGDEDLVYSALVEDRIGYVIAGVRLDGARRVLRKVRLYGDFMLDSPGLAELERRLSGHPVDRRLIALSIDEVLGSQHHVVVGLRRLGSILDAIWGAANKEG